MPALPGANFASTSRDSEELQGGEKQKRPAPRGAAAGLLRVTGYFEDIRRNHRENEPLFR